MLPLALTASGEAVRVRAIRGANGDTQRLRELGLLEGKTIEVVCNDQPMICKVGDGRLCLCRNLARCIFVEPVSAATR